MASTKYYTILTKVGQAKIANAIAYGRKLQLTEFVLGDGGGASYDPDESQTALKHEVYRANVGNVVISDETINMLEVNMAVPANVGGWVVREMGILDTDGDLIAISKTPDDPKPGADSGAAKDVVYRLFIIVTNTDAVEIKIDPTVTVATKAEVEAVAASVKQLSKATENALNNKMSKAQKLVNEDLNNIIEEGFYYGDGGNTCTNKPPNVVYFGLYVIRSGEANSFVTQYLLDTNNNKQYIRYFNGAEDISAWYRSSSFSADPVSGQVVVANGTKGDIKTSGFTLNKSVPANAVFTDTTYNLASTSAHGLMSKEDKTRLNGMDTGAQKNTVTGVKGSAESTYRTGNINITPANIGAATPANITAALDKYNIRTYSTLAQIGLSDKDFSPTDFEGNMNVFLSKLLNMTSGFLVSLSEENSTFSKSVLEKINKDLNENYPVGTTSCNIYFLVPLNVYRPFKINCSIEYANNNKIYSCIFNKNSSAASVCSKFAVSFDLNNSNGLSGIKSIQFGRIAIPIGSSMVNAYINPVNLDKTFISEADPYTGSATDSVLSQCYKPGNQVYLQLRDQTQAYGKCTVWANIEKGSETVTYVPYRVVEFY